MVTLSQTVCVQFKGISPRVFNALDIQEVKNEGCYPS